MTVFARGIHVHDRKEATRGQAIREAPAPARVVIPLLQHTGAPARCLVKKGDEVREGQMIGEPVGFISAAIHSSVSGKVASVGPLGVTGGRTLPCVVIDADGKGEQADADGRAWEELSPGEIVERVRNAGVVGMGGAAFPTAVKLSVPPGRKAEAVILNACECEPFLTCDERVLLERTADVLTGLAILRRAVGCDRAVIAVESNKRSLIPLLRPAASGLPFRTEVRVLPERYPQGSEKQLIQSVLMREVGPGKLPIDAGCVVFNVQTAVAVKEAVAQGLPVTRRVLTVSGRVRQPANLRVRIGTPVPDILAQAGGTSDADARVVVGGPMMGVQLFDRDVPVVKGTSGILALPPAAAAAAIEPCIRCGKCVQACPMRLSPAEMSRYAELRLWDACAGFNLADCMECGCCSYVCPARRPLVEWFRWAKAEIRARAGRAGA